MATKGRKLELESRWRKLVAQHLSSGLSVRAFCERERVSEPSFYAWRRTVRERVPPQSPATPAFVPMVVSDVGTPQPAAIVLELHGGHRLRLPETMAADRIVALVRALEATS